MSKMFKLLQEGLGGIIDHQKGKKKLRIRVVDFLKPAKSLSANDVTRMRKSLNYPQHLFAKFLTAKNDEE